MHFLKPDIYSLYIIFYKISVNVSANFLHRLLKIYESYQSHIYSHPYSDYQTGFSNLLDTNDESSFGKQKSQIESLAKKFEKYIPLQKNSFIFKEPLIKIHPFSHLPAGQTTQVIFLERLTLVRKKITTKIDLGLRFRF